MQSVSQKLEESRLIGMGKMITFIAVVVVLYLVLWLPYLKDLNMKIWRTKGMLNMIPMNIIIKNERLKNEFTSGMLEKAVRWPLYQFCWAGLCIIINVVDFE